MRTAGIILLVATVVASYQYVTTRPIERPAGVLVVKDPEQEKLDGEKPIVEGDFLLQPRANFTADARVLASERYHMGKLADVAPLDIAVGWGEMSDSAVLGRLDITQGNRFYYWHYDDEPPIPINVIVSHSANWHLLPANDAVWKSLRRVRVGDVVHLEGLLVDIQSPEEGVIRTSLTRDDTGPGACEVIYVKAVLISGG